MMFSAVQDAAPFPSLHCWRAPVDSTPVGQRQPQVVPGLAYVACFSNHALDKWPASLPATLVIWLRISILHSRPVHAAPS